MMVIRQNPTIEEVKKLYTELRKVNAAQVETVNTLMTVLFELKKRVLYAKQKNGVL